MVKTKLPGKEETRLLGLLDRPVTGLELADLYKSQYRKNLLRGTLYSTLRRLRERGWVVVERESEDEDGRVRWFRITATGSKAYRDAVKTATDFVVTLPKAKGARS